MTSSTTLRPSAARRGSIDWWFRSREGQLTLWQWPNPALWVWMVASALGRFDLSATQATAIHGVARGALLVWALDELVRGASPFRRVLGAAVLAAQLAALALG